MQIRQWAVVVGVASMLMACGDDEEDNKPVAQAATVNKQAASSNAQGTIAAVSATTKSDENGSSVFALSGVAQSSQALLSAGPGVTTKSVAFPLNIEGDIATRDIGSPGCTCTGTSCTFTDCSFGGTSAGGSASYTISGSYSWGGGKVTCTNLKYNFSGSGAAGGASGVPGYSTTLEITLNCDLTVTTTSINGFVKSAGSSLTNAGGQSVGTTWDVKTTYNNVTFSAPSYTPTGGSLKVEGTSGYTAGGATQNFAGSGEIMFP